MSKYSQKRKDDEWKTVEESIKPSCGHEVEIEQNSTADVDDNGVHNQRADNTTLTLYIGSL